METKETSSDFLRKQAVPWCTRIADELDNLEEKVLQLTSSDFYKKMRFCSALFPGQDHRNKSWYDVFEEFKRRLGVTEGGPDKGFIAKASEFEDKVAGNYVGGDCMPQDAPSCGCCCPRPVVDWPDSEGNWWCDKFPYPTRASRDCHGIHLGIEGHDTWLRQLEFEKLNLGPARFTKLIEANPFEEK